MDVLYTLIGTWLGLLVLPLWFLFITILFIKQLSDDPGNPKKPYFFTAVEPGQIKAVLRGGNVIRYLMNYAGFRFSETGTDPTKDEHWDVETGLDPHPFPSTVSFNLLKYLFWPFFALTVFDWFVSVVYRVTRHIFVGIWPFQILYLYRFTRKVQKIDEHGKPLSDEHGLPILEDNLEWTDHVRARSFVWKVKGQAGETREGLKVQVRGIANVLTTNPQKALFGTDQWDTVLTSTILQALASIIRTMPIDEVLLSKQGNKDALAVAVKDEANLQLQTYGLYIDDYQIIDFEAQLSEDDTKALTAQWRAERNKEAERITGEGRGEGRAAEIKKVAEAVKAGGVAAKRAQELEALIRQAEAVGKGGGVVILGGQTGADGLQAALLAEIKKLNEGKK